MTKNKKSTLLSAIFMSAMLFAPSAQANDITVNDEASLNSALENSSYTRIFLGNDINVTSPAGLNLLSGKTLIGGDKNDMKTLSLSNNMSYFMWDTENYFNLEYIKFKDANFTVNQPITVTSLNCEYDGKNNTQDSSLYTISGSMASFTSNGKNTFSNFVKAKNGGVFNIGDSQYADNNELHLNSDTFNNNESSEKGGAIAYMGYQNVIGDHNILEVADTSFNTNKSANGGAIYSQYAYEMNIKSTVDGNSSFTGNEASENGGAIYNRGSKTFNITGYYNEAQLDRIKKVIFKNNTAGNSGGAIYNMESKFNISDAEFTSNTATNGEGGAIWTTGNGTITRTDFTDNKSNGDGGAIYNNSSSLILNAVNFLGNTATASGGALYNDNATLTIEGGTFKGNTSESQNGGAIIDAGYNTTISNAIFENNKASEGNGGAIYKPYGNIDLTNTNFIGNSAKMGGAIYNYNATVNIKADNGNIVLFDGNMATENEASSDIYNAKTVNLEADETSSVTFNGNIGNDGNSIGTINISSSNKGTINFNGKVSYQNITLDNGTLALGLATAGETNYLDTVKLTLNGGTLELGKNASGITNDYFKKVNLTLNGGTLSSANGAIDQISIGTFDITGDSNFDFDIDISSETGKSDFLKMLLYTEGDKKLKIGKLQILAGMEEGQDRSKIKFSNMADLNTIIDEINKKISYDNVNYDVVVKNNILTILREGTAIDFAHAVIDTKDEKTYRIGATDEIVSWVKDKDNPLKEDNTLKGKKLTLKGGSNGKVIKGETSSVEGISLGVDADGNAQEFVVENVASYENFYVGIRNNGGKVTIKNSTLQKNKSTAVSQGDIYFYGGAIHNAAGTVDIENSNFAENNTTTKGGAIYSKSGILNIKNTNFTENTSVNGGALYLTEGASATIDGGVFDGNESDGYGGAIFNNGAGTIKITGGIEFKNSYADKEGGAIYNDGGNLEISDAKFSDNTGDNDGGAIYHGSGIANIDNTKFTNNKGNSGSGAIYNGNAGTMKITNSSFEGNISSSFGGAIKNDGSLTIENTSFKNNTSNYNGGAIYNLFNSTMTISNSSFEDNNTQGYGGAIANFGNLTLENTSFKNNTSNDNGGAIYNSRNLTIKATGGNEVEFTDNKASSDESNGIHNGGYLYLTADDTSSITFNDNIGGYGNIYITDENTGTINFNNKITTQSIHLNGGTLALGQNASIRTTDYFDTVNLTLNGGTFSMKNDRIDEVTVASLTIGDNNPNYMFDVNISDIAGESDKIIVNDTFNKDVNGTLNLGPLNILAGMTDDQIRSDMEFSNQDINAVIDEVNKHITYDGTTYDIYAEGNKIIVMRGGYAIDFAHAILDDTNLERTYQIPNSGENVTDWLKGNNNLVGTKFQLLGGNGTKTIQGNNIEGIIIGTYNGTPQNYIVKDVDSYTGFYSAIINNGGVVDLTNTTFNNNNSPYDGGAIQNNSGTVNINNGVTFEGNKATYNGGAIYNGENGTINFNLTNAGDSVKFENNINGDIYNAGTVNFNGEGEVSFNGGILGTVTSSMVNNGAKVYLSGPNLYYEGEYIQNSGRTVVLNQFTKGTTTINGGDVSWLTDGDKNTKVTFNGGNLYIGSTGNNASFTVGRNSSIDGAELVYINDGSTLNIEKDTKIGNIDGNGNFNVGYSRIISFDDNSKLGTGLNTNITMATVKFDGTSEGQTGSILGTLAQDNVTLNDVQYWFENTTITPNLAVDGSEISRILTTGDVNLNGQITSTKYGYFINEGNLTVSENQSGFKGSFYQDRENTKTTINDSSNMFGGDKNIEKSELIVSGGSLNYDKVNLGKDAKLSQTLTTDAANELNSNIIKFTEDGARAEFVSNGSVRNISLKSGIDNGKANTISFDNVKVSLADKNYIGKTLYDFKNSEINLIDGTGNLNNYVFDNIKTDNTKLDFNLKINRDDGNGNTISTDNVTVKTSDTQKFDIGDIYITGEENGQLGDYSSTNNLVDGNAELNEPSSPILAGATTSWIYKIVLDGKNKVKMAIQNYSDENTLNDMNKQGGKRFFQFTEGDTRDYHIGSSLDETAAGEFLVKGDNKNVISGAIVDSTGALTGKNGDLFKLNNETKLTIDNVTIKDTTQIAYVNNDNAELNIKNSDFVNNLNNLTNIIEIIKGSANIENSTFDYNGGGLFGGAIGNGGTLKVSNSKFTRNGSVVFGGAISNNGTADISGTIFEKNGSQGNGGAVNNLDAGNMTISNNSKFSENESSAGGAIANGGNLNVDGTTFTKNKATGTDQSPALGYGGAITTGGTTTITNSEFTENTATYYGGAISNEGTLNIENTIFENNEAKKTYATGTTTAFGYGGAIAHIKGSTTVKNSSFKGNKAYKHGGAILAQEGTLTLENTEFTDNKTSYSGGAISTSEEENKDITIDIKNSSFKNNTANDFAGAIYNYKGKLNIADSTFESNNAMGNPAGAIYNNGGDATITNTDFIGNTALGDGSTYGGSAGGAISNTGNLDVVGGKFDSNKAYLGGALYNSGNASFKDTLFISNEATSSLSPNANGGAIKNASNLTLTDVTFSLNTASGRGGAIYNTDDEGSAAIVNIIAENNDIVFSGNTDSEGSNAIYNNTTGSGVEINLNAGSKDIIFEDAIDGGTANIDKQIININKNNGSAPTDGYVEFDNVVKNNTVNLYDGFLAFDEMGNFDSSVVFNVNGGSIDLVNDNIQNVNLGNLTLNSNLNLYLDGNFVTKELDTITADGFTANGNTINIAGINIIEPTEEKTFSISPLGTFSDSAVKDAVSQAIRYTGGDIAYSPIYKYKVTYDPTSTMLNFGLNQGGSPSDNFNPAILSAPVGAQLGAYLNQINIYEQAFSNMDMMMIMPRAQRNAMKFANKYASSQGTGNGGVITFSPNQIPEQNHGLWFRPYTTFENVNLNKGPNVKNISYGSLFGGDSGIIELKHGWDMVASAYGSYNGSNQNYDGVTMTQNGGSLGISGAWYKGNFYTGLTANVGANSGEANSMYGKDHFTSLATGVASKTGYNWELTNGKFILQPNFLMSYTFVNTFDYTNAAGVKISSDPLNSIQIAPGVKIIGNLKNGWQPYLGVQMVWNIIDKAKFKANNVELPNMSIDPYVQYGVGVQKKVGDRFTGFGQAMMRNGGRNGISLQFGFRWSL